MAVNKNTFSNTTKLVIDNLEGGYYHPNMLKDGRVKDFTLAQAEQTIVDDLTNQTYFNQSVRDFKKATKALTRG